MSNVCNSVSARWYDAVDIDFTAQPTQTLAPDGNYTIAGTAFTKVNSANEASAMVITNGVGLVITPAAASGYGGATRTLPMLTVALSTIIPNVSWDTRFRVWLYIVSQNAAANYDQVTFGVERQPPTLTSFRHQIAYINIGPAVACGLNWNSGDNGSSFNCAAYPNTLMFDMTYGLGGVQMHGFHSDLGPSFAPIVSMVTSGYCYRHTAASNITNTYTAGFDSPGTCNIFLGAGRAGSGTAFVATLGALKVEYFR